MFKAIDQFLSHFANQNFTGTFFFTVTTFFGKALNAWFYQYGFSAYYGAQSLVAAVGGASNAYTKWGGPQGRGLSPIPILRKRPLQEGLSSSQTYKYSHERVLFSYRFNNADAVHLV